MNGNGTRPAGPVTTPAADGGRVFSLADYGLYALTVFA